MTRTGTKHFAASALIEREGRFLLLFHKKLGLWLYPGGHVEANEEPQEALVREVREEVGLDVAVLSCGRDECLPLDLDNATVAELAHPLSILCERIADGQGGHHWHVDLIYLCQTASDRPSSPTPESEFVWVTPAEARKLKCPRELPSLMDRALAVLKANADG
jgi:8-oxo-dGTP pyrophosphatase MutT (NUDIX family)